jgi:hypothetical protein
VPLASARPSAAAERSRATARVLCHAPARHRALPHAPARGVARAARTHVGHVAQKARDLLHGDVAVGDRVDALGDDAVRARAERADDAVAVGARRKK